MIILELSGEHQTLPKAEAVACLESGFNRFKIIDEAERVLVADVNYEELKFLGIRQFSEGKLARGRTKFFRIPNLNSRISFDSSRQLNVRGSQKFKFVKDDVSKLSRLSLSHYVDEFLFSCPTGELFDCAKTIKVDGTFKVNVKHVAGKKTSNIERKIGGLIHGKVDLKNPENEIRIIVSDRCFAGKKILKIDRKQFDKRKPQFRPFFSPISLHPRLARALVNLSRIKKNQILFDPFCGTGGILIEAGLVGAKTVGSDIDEKMVKGCRENLEYFGIKNYALFQSDVGDVNIKCDAVVTDPPYGRSASTKKENIEKLYERAFEVFRKILKKERYLVIALPDKRFMELGKNYLNLLEFHPVRVHRSLTRYFCVYRKQGKGTVDYKLS